MKVGAYTGRGGAVQTHLPSLVPSTSLPPGTYPSSSFLSRSTTTSLSRNTVPHLLLTSRGLNHH
ncbi:hypothetical protein E2C01_081710 [Portunus trituberculatus]|uniref:Uncharacterized protein n=1 Tax=Portunus trituberculatus TaxID=210409 RepID=A0A5B7IX87_PORTR|nr:hypothetical protein [Portunus trituberculatus]